MNWYARNNAFGGIDLQQAEAPSAGFVAVTAAQAAAIMGAPPGSIIDGSGNLVAPVTPFVPVSQQPAMVAKRAVRNALLGGFQSSALGSPYAYGSSEADQRNLAIAAVAATQGDATAIWCANSSGVWALATHTAAQVIQLARDWNKFRATQSATLASGLG